MGSSARINGKREWSEDCEKARLKGHFVIEKSAAMQEIFWQMTKVRLESNVLLTGETGTGKSFVARMINRLHQATRKDVKQHVEVNVASLSRDLIASELFGHVKGSFSGAMGDRTGRFEEANGGSLMLDEIGEVPLQTQVQLLSAYDAPRIIQKVGNNKQVLIELVAMAGTTKNLRSMVTEGEFDAALYERLREKVIHMPSLKERGPEYIAHLVPTLLTKLANGKHEVLTAAAAVIERIQGMTFKGNVRDLFFLLKEMTCDAYDAGDAVLTERHLDDALAARGEEPEISDDGAIAGTLKRVRDCHINRVLDKYGGHVASAAKELGIDRGALYRILQKRVMGARSK